jgi:hypothetical protein
LNKAKLPTGHLLKEKIAKILDFQVEFTRERTKGDNVVYDVSLQNKLDTFPPQAKRWFGTGRGYMITVVEA